MNFLFKIVSEIVDDVENCGALVPKMGSCLEKTPFHKEPLQKKRII